MPTPEYPAPSKAGGLRYEPKNIVAGYVELVQSRINDGWEPTLISFIFDPIHGSPAAVADAMRFEIERVYGWMLTRRCRRPRETPNHRKPILIACPDWPVPKQHKSSLEDAIVNGGRHLHGFDLTPPWTRLTCELADFIDEHQTELAGPAHPLSCVHAVTMRQTPERAVAYILKSLTRGRATGDDLIVLPRASSETHHARSRGTTTTWRRLRSAPRPSPAT